MWTALIIAWVLVAILVVMVIVLLKQLHESNREILRCVELMEGFMNEEEPSTPTKSKTRTMWG